MNKEAGKRKTSVTLHQQLVTVTVEIHNTHIRACPTSLAILTSKNNKPRNAVWRALVNRFT